MPFFYENGLNVLTENFNVANMLLLNVKSFTPFVYLFLLIKKTTYLILLISGIFL